MKTDLVEIFQSIRATMQPYAASGFGVMNHTERLYELWTEKSLETSEGKKAPVFFAAVMIREHTVGFYFMPVHTTEEIAGFFPSDLLALRDEKSFSIQQLDDQLLNQISDVLAAGYRLFKERAWV